MGLFYYFFNALGVIFVLIISLAVAIPLVIRTILKGYHHKRKIALIVAVFVFVQVLSVSVLLSDFSRPSIVDITPLQALGSARIEDFEGKQAALEETRYFLKKNDFAYQYSFQYWDRPSVEMTIYVMEDAEEAYRNLLASAGTSQEEKIQKLSDSIWVYRSDSKMWRGRFTSFDENLSRVADTCFMIDNILFVLHERGSGAEIGATTNEVIALLCDTFLPR